MIFQSISVPRISALLVPFAFWVGSTTSEPKEEELCLEENKKTIQIKDTIKVVDSSLIHALINVESRGKSNL